MHPSTPYRKSLTLAVFGIALIPVVVSLCLMFPWNDRRTIDVPHLMAHPVAVATVAISLAAMLGLVIWKRAAAMPELTVIPCVGLLICGSAGAFKMAEPSDSQYVDKAPPTLTFSGKFDGTEVWCNGVKLGEIPLQISHESFYSKVKPVDTPPTQDAVVSGHGDQLSFGNARLSSIPLDPFSDAEDAESETSGAMMERFGRQKYWWTFRNGPYRALLGAVSGRANFGGLTEREWKAVDTHARLLRLLAKHEDVDPLVKYADHIAKFPALRIAMTPEEPKPRVMNQFDKQLDKFTKQADSTFEQAVWNQDWLAIARSDDPRSGPLLHWCLDSQRHSGTFLLTFSDDVAAVVMQSSDPSVQRRVRDLMAEANFSHMDILTYYIDRQLAIGADRNELTEWLSGNKTLGTDYHTLVMKIGADNLPEHFGDLHQLVWLDESVRNNPPATFIIWLIERWQQNPSRDLAQELSRHAAKPEVRAAIATTDLTTPRKLADFLEVMFNSYFSRNGQKVYCEPTAKAFLNATKQSDVDRLAQVLGRLPGESGLKALQAYTGPKSRFVDSATKRVSATLTGEKAKIEADIKLARQLISGEKHPNDLVVTRKLVWTDGGYVLEGK